MRQDVLLQTSLPAEVGRDAFVEGVLEAAPDAFMVVDAEGRISLMNAQTERLFGYTRDELLGKAVETLIPGRFGSRHARLRGTYQQSPRRRPMGTGQTLFGRRKDGSEFAAEISLSPLQIDHQPTLTIAIVRDVTERQRIEHERIQLLARAQQAYAEAEHAIAVRDQVLAAVSHDLKAPLTVINGRAQLLVRRLQRMNAGQAEHLIGSLREIEASVRRMRSWIDELVDVAHLQVGQELHLNRTKTDLVALARATAAEYHGTCEGNRLRVEASEPELVGEWDAERLQRVLANLISNAIKYSPIGGKISVLVNRERNKTVIRIADEGAGLSPEDLGRLFGRFQRLSAKPTAGESSTGLGLSIVKRIIDMHGGQVTAESGGPGHGSTFTVVLPAADMP
jgi:PAS domain S-box-containing protein